MPKQVAASTEHYTIEIDEEIDAIVHTWEEFLAGEAFRDGCRELLDVIRQHDKSKLLVDTSGIQAHDEADLQWLEEEFIPAEIDAGIEYSVSVPGDSVISEMEMEEFVDQTSDLPFTYVLAGDLQEAREWLAEQ